MPSEAIHVYESRTVGETFKNSLLNPKAGVKEIPDLPDHMGSFFPVSSHSGF